MFAALQPGTIFAGRYAVERLLRQGGMGAVYVVRHVRTHALLALKVMRPEVALDASMRERFAREAQVSSLIRSAHVVTVVDADVDPTSGMPFLVMELLRGCDLGERLRAGRLPFVEVARFVGQTARALDRAHALGIVHRDLKPENLFLSTSDDEPPRIKVLDFGIAKIVQAATLLGQSQQIGTPLYMAPEQMQHGSEIGPWTDVWALGLTAYTLLVGRPYWEGGTVHEIYGEILLDARTPSTARAARAGVILPPAFDAWFSCCTDRVPARRFASTGEAAVALARALDVVDDTPPPPIAFAASGAGTTVAADARATDASPAATAPMTQLATSTELAHAPAARRRPGPSRAPLALGIASGVVIVAATALALRDETPATPSAPASSATSASKNGKPPPSSAPTSAPTVAPMDAPIVAIEASNPFVALGSIAMQRHEVTRGEYALYVRSLAPKARGRAVPLAEADELDDALVARRPVVWITHARATDFCRALGARLPNGADWKRALGGEKYPWGAAFPPPGAVAFDRPGSTSLPDVESSTIDRTTDGVYDLFGSVREWTADVEGEFAAVRGVALATTKSDAPTVFATPSLKDADEGADPASHADEIAGPQIGFRCVR